ncbi:MAG: hypothetical protein LBQ50_14885 [Planctomycetaceae bacterium]|nr:hypothetical protein [Planctomycetaceae bacterium]
MTKHYYHRTWVTQELAPFCSSNSILIAANHYNDPQTAWESWTMPDDMLCALVKMHSDRSLLTQCACRLAAVTLPILETRTDDGKLFRTALGAARQWAVLPHAATLHLATELISDVNQAANQIIVPLSARYAAQSVYKALRTVSSPQQAQELAFGIECALLTAIHPIVDGAPLSKNLLAGVKNEQLTEKTIRQWQCDLVRQFFPNRPVYQKATVPNIFALKKSKAKRK